MFRALQHFLLTTLLVLFASQANALFIQSDWLNPTEPGVGTNRYSYSFNDPVNLRDPSGNQAEPGPVERAVDAVVGPAVEGIENAAERIRKHGVHEGLRPGLDAAVPGHAAMGELMDSVKEGDTAGAIIAAGAVAAETATSVLGAGIAANATKTVTKPVATVSTTTAARIMAETALNEAFDSPKSLYGKTAEQIAGLFKDAGYEATIQQGTRGHYKARIVHTNHSDVNSVKVHPGGGRHKAGYVTISSSTRGLTTVTTRAYRREAGQRTRFVFVD